MKKLILLAAILLAANTVVSAENTTRIGSQHRLDFGVFMGYAPHSDLNWYGMGFFDINAANNNMRTRFNLGLAETFMKGGKFIGIQPNVAIDLQYLLRITDGLYIYPSVGVYGEMFSKNTAHNPQKNIGLEGGLGLELQFTSGFGIFCQGDYQLIFGNANRLGGRAGVVMHF